MHAKLSFIFMGFLMSAVSCMDNLQESHSAPAKSRVPRSALLHRAWTKNGNFGITFIYSDQFSSGEIHAIISAAKEISQHSCIPVNVYSLQQYWNGGASKDPFFYNYVFISRIPYAGCNADIGMSYGKQNLNLDPLSGCSLSKGAIMHEMIHSLGYDHEQNRPDRDNYVSIHFNNVIPGQVHNFMVSRSSRAVGPYDYGSIMQYPSTSFAANSGYSTISSRLPGYQVPYSPNLNLSSMDKKKIRFITGCKDTAF